MKIETFESTSSRKYSDEQISDEIAKMAYHIHKEKSLSNLAYPIIRRRELVKQLNENLVGLQLTDTLRVNSIVRLAYQTCSETIQNAIIQIFKQNLGNDSLYNPKRIYPSNKVLSGESDVSGSFDDHLNILSENSAEIDNQNAKSLIEQKFEETQSLTFEKGFLGIGNADSSKEYGRKVLAGYEAMIEEYEVIKDVNLNLINDFETLRNELKEQREDVVQLIIDLFGDRAKSAHPELFDLGQIEWHNFEENWSKLTLAHNRLENEYQGFLNIVDASLSKLGSDISTQANKSWKSLEKTAGKRDLNQKDLINAGAEMAITAGVSAITGAIKSRNKSKEVVATIQNDVERLKAEMFEDQRLILKDIFRLGKLYSKFSDSVLPNYFEYIKSNNERIQNDFLPIYNRVIQNEVIRKAKDSNNALFRQRRVSNQQLRDYINNIQYSEKQIIELEILKLKLKIEVELVELLRPTKPWLIWSIITFGRADNIYKDTLAHWNQFCKPVVDHFNHTLSQIQSEKQNIVQLNTTIDQVEKSIDDITNSIKINSEKIQHEFSKDPWSTEQMKNLVDVVKTIINSSRSVLEMKLEDELLQKEKPWK